MRRHEQKDTNCREQVAAAARGLPGAGGGGGGAGPAASGGRGHPPAPSSLSSKRKKGKENPTEEVTEQDLRDEQEITQGWDDKGWDSGAKWLERPV